ncbi:cytidylate kinase-like family protein [bacterium]|nr:cytidylate kinase-like family protein [bacterium]
MPSGIDEIINRQINNWDRIKNILGKHILSGEGEGPSTRRQPAIALSRQLGCGTRRVADRLSRQVGYEIIGYSLIEKVAEDIHVQRRIIDALDERARSDIDNFMEGMLRGRLVDNAEYQRSLIRILRTFILQGGVILIGRGAHLVLDASQGVRVRLVAPMEVRIRNLMSYSNTDRKSAIRQIEQSDRQRSDFILKFFKSDISDPENYDMVINLGQLTEETAAGLILRALEDLRA